MLYLNLLSPSLKDTSHTSIFLVSDLRLLDLFCDPLSWTRTICITIRLGLYIRTWRGHQEVHNWKQWSPFWNLPIGNSSVGRSGALHVLLHGTVLLLVLRSHPELWNLWFQWLRITQKMCSTASPPWRAYILQPTLPQSTVSLELEGIKSFRTEHALSAPWVARRLISADSLTWSSYFLSDFCVMKEKSQYPSLTRLKNSVQWRWTLAFRT